MNRLDVASTVLGIVLLNSGSSGAYAFNHNPETLRSVHSYRQPSPYFPTPSGTFAGESLPGKVTWARRYVRGDALGMDIGTGEVVKLPDNIRDEWRKGTTREWPFMATDLRMSRDTLMAHYLSSHVAVATGTFLRKWSHRRSSLDFVCASSTAQLERA